MGPTASRRRAPSLPDLPQGPPVPRSRMPPCRASLHERWASAVAAEKQRCLRKGCCRNRGKLTGVSRRGSGSSCVWSPERRQRGHSCIHAFALQSIIRSPGESNHEILRGGAQYVSNPCYSCSVPIPAQSPGWMCPGMSNSSQHCLPASASSTRWPGQPPTTYPSWPVS